MIRSALPRSAKLLAAALGAATLFAALPAQADPSVRAIYGKDNKHGIEKYGVDLDFDSGFHWGNPEGWFVNLDWEVALGQWRSLETLGSPPRRGRMPSPTSGSEVRLRST